MNEPHPAIASFTAEAREMLEALEGLLLDLETDAGAARVDAVFRTLHTVKGSGAMFGFTVLARFTHHFEEAFDRVREGRLVVGRELIDLALRARDHMLALLDCGGDGPDARALEQGEAAQTLLARLAELTASAPAGNVSDQKGEAPETVQGTALPGTRWRIRFRPAAEALRNGMRPDLLAQEVAGLGDAEIGIEGADVPQLEDIKPDICYLGWDIALDTARPLEELESVFIFADNAELQIAPIEPSMAGAVAADDSAEAADGAEAQDASAAPSDASGIPVPAADATGSGSARTQGAGSGQAGRESVRVPAGKLDSIIDQLGELVIVQSRLHQIAAASNDAELEGVVEEVERLVAGLRDSTLSIRMLPIEVVFGKFRRVVRDLSGELGKSVELVAEGGETELDKNVIDRLGEPLVHMIRNAVDHGIEDVPTRRQRGKPDSGTVTLAARQEGGEVLITVSDDGGGLDAEAIRVRAVERGLLAPDDRPNDADLHQLVFAPGFSTARELSSVSGRGVGMDAVRSAIEALRGSLEVGSQSGQGTRITLRLPVTLSIIDGLLVKLGSGTFVIPLAVVEECVELAAAERNRESGRSMLRIREQMVAFRPLDQALGMVGHGECDSLGDQGRVVVVRAEGQRLGLVVEEILGLNQTVIKPLSIYHRAIPGLAGATILGDGAVALIVDVVTLCRQGIARVRGNVA